MKRFSFTLDRVLGFRRQQEELERGRLRALLAEQAALLGRAGQLQEESRRQRAACLLQDGLTALDLRRVHEYALHLNRVRTQTLEAAGDKEQLRKQQLQRVLEVQRKVRLLETLKSRRLAEHRRETDRELENLAAELHRARLLRENRGGPAKKDSARPPAAR